MGESRIDIPQTPQVTEKAKDEGGKGTQIISSIPQTPQVTEKTEDKGGKSTQNNSSMLKEVLRFLHVNRTVSSQPPEKANDQVGIQPQSNDLAAEKLMFPLGLFHSLWSETWPKLSPIQYESPDSHVIAGVPLKDDSHLLEFVYENIISSSDFEHPLEFVYENIIGSPSHPSGTTLRHKRRVRHITLPRAEQLKGKGVKFARNEGLLKKIRFDRRNLTLYLPAIEMDSGTDTLLRNLVLFEASKQGKESQPLMSYVNLMDRLIDTAEDAQTLVNSGIIHANLGCNIEVAKVWNGMFKLIDKKIKYEPIDKAIYDVKNFYTNKYITMCTEFYGTHFSKPWSAISFFAACILFALAAFQTYLAWEQVRLQRESMHKT